MSNKNQHKVKKLSRNQKSDNFWQDFMKAQSKIMIEPYKMFHEAGFTQDYTVKTKWVEACKN